MIVGCDVCDGTVVTESCRVTRSTGPPPITGYNLPAHTTMMRPVPTTLRTQGLAILAEIKIKQSVRNHGPGAPVKDPLLPFLWRLANE